MAVPATLSDDALRLYAQLEPLAFDDENRLYALAHLCQAFIGSLQEVDDYARNYTATRIVQAGAISVQVETEKPGWSRLFDLTRIPDNAVPWLAQFVGVWIPRYAGEDDAAFAARLKPLIIERTGWKRGTPAAIKALAASYLTGTKTVFLVERQGSAYTFAVTTWASETPNPAALLSALVRFQKPGGLLMNVSQIVGGDFNTLLATHTNFTDVNTPVTTFDAVRTNPSL
jgi:hypothetical protein